MPEFKQDAAERERRKLEELAPYLEQAMARKQKMKELADDEIPPILALGRQIAETDDGNEVMERLREVGSIITGGPKS